MRDEDAGEEFLVIFSVDEGMCKDHHKGEDWFVSIFWKNAGMFRFASLLRNDKRVNLLWKKNVLWYYRINFLNQYYYVPRRLRVVISRWLHSKGVKESFRVYCYEVVLKFNEWMGEVMKKKTFFSLWLIVTN